MTTTSRPKKFHGAIVLASTVGMSEEMWQQIRRGGIGGSDIGTIAGLNSMGTALGVYLNKVENIDSKVGRTAQWGKWMEDPIARDAARRLNMKGRRVNAILQHPKYPWMLANIDRLIVGGKPAIHEIKLIVSRERAAKLKKEVEEGQPRAFPSHEAQVRWYMAVTGIKYAVISYEIAYGEPLDIIIEHDQEIEDHLIKIGQDFWQLVVNRTPPAMDGSDAADTFLQAAFSDSVPGEIELPPEAGFAIQRYESASEVIKRQEEIKSQAKQELELLLGHHQAGRVNGRLVTWKPQDMGRFDSTQFRKDYPTLYPVYVKENIKRVLRIK